MLFDLLRCPSCHRLDDLHGYDCMGACGDNLICPDCHCEFDPATGLEHVPGPCCEEVGVDPIQRKIDKYREDVGE